MKTHEVLRAFQGDIRYQAGEQVDATGWRNLEKLIDQRYLKALPIVVSDVLVQQKEQPRQQGNQQRR